jgi:hypothetical protein
LSRDGETSGIPIPKNIPGKPIREEVFQNILSNLGQQPHFVNFLVNNPVEHSGLKSVNMLYSL